MVHGKRDVVALGELEGVSRPKQEPVTVRAVSAGAGIDEDVRYTAPASHEEASFGWEPSNRWKVIIYLQMNVVVGQFAGLCDRGSAETELQARAKGDAHVEKVDPNRPHLLRCAPQAVVKSDRSPIELVFRADSRADAGPKVPADAIAQSHGSPRRF
jgi:hypothetical protein